MTAFIQLYLSIHLCIYLHERIPRVVMVIKLLSESIDSVVYTGQKSAHPWTKTTLPRNRGDVGTHIPYVFPWRFRNTEMQCKVSLSTNDFPLGTNIYLVGVHNKFHSQST